MNTRTPRPRSLLSLLAGAALGLPLLACDGVEDQDATIAADSEDVEESEVGEDSGDSEDVDLEELDHADDDLKPAALEERKPSSPNAPESAQDLAAPVDASEFEFTSLSASPEFMLVGTATTVTATFGVDVGPTPYYHLIFDKTTGQLVKACGYGTTCSASVTHNVETTREYVAYRASYSNTYPPPNVQTMTSPTSATWRQSLVLNATAHYPWYNQDSHIYATSAWDVGPTPHYIQIYDTTTGERVAVCGTGTMCVHTMSGLGWHDFIAYVGSFSLTYPPPNVQSTSNATYVFWQKVY